MEISEDLLIDILDVVYFEREKGVYKTNGRNFSALTMRFNSETTYITKKDKINAKANDICLVPKAVDYTSVTESEKMIVVHFDMTNLYTDKIQCFTPENPEKFQAVFKDILRVWEEKKPGYKLSATSLFYKVLSEIKKAEYETEQTENRFVFAAEYMKRHFSDQYLSIADVAKKVGVCDSFFRREFKREIGISPKKYLDNLRIEYAILLMNSDYFSHEEIASRCGYTDVKYFRSAFKNKTGECISKYKYDAKKSINYDVVK